MTQMRRIGAILKESCKSIRSASSAFYSLFVLVWTLFIFSPLVADPDLWGHVRFGQDTLLTRTIVRADTYSYLTAGQPWINHEWLTEVAYALAYNAAGSAGLLALNLTFGLLILGLIYAWLVRTGLGKAGALLLTVGVSFVLRPGVLNVRPQVFTYLLLLALVILLAAYTGRDRATSPGGRVDLRFIAAVWTILALWTNLHGGVLAGLAVLYLWGATYLVEAISRGRSFRVLARQENLTVLTVLALAPTALLVNPYGVELAPFLLRTATVARPEILEWHGVRLNDLWSLDWLAAFVVTVVAVALSRRPRRLPLLVPLAVVALMPLSAVRHIPLFAVVAPVLAADHFADLWERVKRLGRRRRDLSGCPNFVGGRNLTGLWLGAVLVMSGVFVALAIPRLEQGIQILPASAGFPVRAVAALKAANVQGNMATEFNWGEYVIWHLGPLVQVSMDGRRETVYTEAVYRENLNFMRGADQWDRLVDRPETELALVDRERPGYTLMLGKAGWSLAYEDDLAAVFVRSGVPFHLDAETAPAWWPADGAGLAFPVE